MEKKLFTFDEIKLKMANYCIYQDRCHWEVEQKMKEFVLIAEAKDELRLFLLQNDFLNEERFTKSYVRGKFKQKKWGKKKIKIHLLQKMISEKMITDALKSEIDDKDYKNCLAQLLEKQLPSTDFSFAQKNKAIQYLLQKGYEYDTILETLKERL